MKNPAILMILCGAILTSCQTNSASLVTNFNENSVEIKPLVSPTPTTLPTPMVSATPKLKAKFDINSKIGIIDGDIEHICFRTKNGNLAENTPVSIITEFYESSQKVLNAKVEKKLKESCSRRASESTDKNPGENFYYSLTLTEKEIDEYQEVFGIGVIEPETPFRFQNKMASIDLNNDGKAEFFRRCAGFEGVLFAIWTGKPLKGKQIWHSFYYLDYDTVETCTKKD